MRQKFTKKSSAEGFASRVGGNVTDIRHEETCDANYVVHYQSRTQKGEVTEHNDDDFSEHWED